MGSLNMVTLVGNLGRDAELRYTQGGSAVASFSMATTETWNDKSGQRKEQTEWHRCVYWGKAAEAVSQYLVKGKQVCVIGRLQTRKWQDKDGNDKWTTEIKVDRLQLLGGGGDGSRRASGGDHDQRRRPQRGGRDEYDQGESQDIGGSEGIADHEPVQELADDDIPFAWLLPLLASAALWHSVIGVWV